MDRQVEGFYLSNKFFRIIDILFVCIDEILAKILYLFHEYRMFVQLER